MGHNVTNAAVGKAPTPTVPLAEQIAAVKEALDTALGIRANVVGKTTAFAKLAELYDRRIAGLTAALATLRSIKED